MYLQDSFFDLSVWGRLGVLGISAVLFAIFLVASAKMPRRWPIWVRVPGALGLFWVFVWVSPQAYYQFYHTLFPNLPVQWVIWPPPSLAEVAELLFFQGPDTLSAHGKALLGWTMIAVQAVKRPALRRSEERS